MVDRKPLMGLYGPAGRPGFQPPRTSVDKLEDALASLAHAKGEDATHGMLLGTFKAMLPTLRKLGYIPDDPAELDTVLLACARWCLGMRSDAAWQPDTIDELFTGPEPATDTTAQEDP